ncbi:WD repeat-containing protein 83 [Spiromyces aspiralis]|uniref:WD repeat-containing protein 83 n=1 Tax=Spiromyces aspiralis TaxID=68401 RepID=A0ACC1HK79_9FUNG|nr:WD repeat-containing protein 83 [Spiromyces aspiralis]
MDNADGSMLNKYTGHENKQYRIQSHLDSEDAFILSGSEDGSIFIWDMLTASVQRNLRHHRHVVTSVSFHPRGLDRLVSASADGTVLLWAGASANQAQS